jgi:hypothetical protein
MTPTPLEACKVAKLYIAPMIARVIHTTEQERINWEYVMSTLNKAIDKAERGQP